MLFKISHSLGHLWITTQILIFLCGISLNIKKYCKGLYNQVYFKTTKNKVPYLFTHLTWVPSVCLLMCNLNA